MAKFYVLLTLALFTLCLVALSFAEDLETEKSKPLPAVTNTGRKALISANPMARNNRRRFPGGKSPRVRAWNKLANLAPGSVTWEQRRSLCRHHLQRKCRQGQIQIGRTMDLNNGKTSACCRTITRNQAMSFARRQCRVRRGEVTVTKKCPKGFIAVGRPMRIGVGSKNIIACCARDRAIGRDSEIPGLVSICRARGGSSLRVRCRFNEERLGRKMPFGPEGRRRAVCCAKTAGAVNFRDVYAEEEDVYRPRRRSNRFARLFKKVSKSGSGSMRAKIEALIARLSGKKVAEKKPESQTDKLEAILKKLEKQ